MMGKDFEHVELCSMMNSITDGHFFFDTNVLNQELRLLEDL